MSFTRSTKELPDDAHSAVDHSDSSPRRPREGAGTGATGHDDANEAAGRRAMGSDRGSPHDRRSAHGRAGGLDVHRRDGEGAATVRPGARARHRQRRGRTGTLARLLHSGGEPARVGGLEANRVGGTHLPGRRDRRHLRRARRSVPRRVRGLRHQPHADAHQYRQERRDRRWPTVRRNHEVGPRCHLRRRNAAGRQGFPLHPACAADPHLRAQACREPAGVERRGLGSAGQSDGYGGHHAGRALRAACSPA